MMERHLLYISLIFILFAPIASAGSHSHYFFKTVTTRDSGYNYPFYYATGSIDDITLYWYDSNNQVIERRVPWFRSTYATLLDASLIEHSWQINFNNTLESLRESMNDTEGFHYLQRLEGCVLYDNKTFDTVFSFHYDGNPFLSFNLKDAKWVAEDPKAQDIADIYNQDRNTTEKNKNILMKSCLPHITQLLSMGNCTFSRKEQPVVIVTRTPVPDFMYILYCRAYGHYPKDISLTWYKNGQPIPENMTEKVTLPLPDITYLTWLSITIFQKNEDVYTCDVEHSSLVSPLTVEWRLNRDLSDGSSGISNGGIIAICLAAILLLVLIIFVSVSLAKRRTQ